MQVLCAVGARPRGTLYLPVSVHSAHPALTAQFGQTAPHCVVECMNRPGIFYNSSMSSLCSPGVPQILGCASSRNFEPADGPPASEASQHRQSQQHSRRRWWQRHRWPWQERGDDDNADEAANDECDEEFDDGLASIYARSTADDDGETTALTPHKRPGRAKKLRSELFFL